MFTDSHRFQYLIALILLGLNGILIAQKLPTPTPAQLQWHERGFYLFMHFGPNTFTDAEWGHGTEPEDIFNPTDLDCDQWCRIAKQAGAAGIILTAKHHDGFCLWPSKYSQHTVRESKWRNGKGDVVRELSEACRRHGLGMGLYLSPWDRNHPQYGTSSYNDVYVNTLTELLTQYGPLFEIWWDGANGEGPNGKKQVYDFHRFERVAAKHQPNAVIFSDIGPGCRWVGNERGVITTATNWSTLDTAGFHRGNGSPPMDTLNQGNERGARWIPAECDVSIRPGWFYHTHEDDKVKSVDSLFSIYLHSFGKNANLLLNVPPDRRGRIHPRDSAALVAFGNKVRQSFAHNLAKGKPAFVGKLKHPTRALTDESIRRPAPPTGERAAWVYEVNMGKPQRFDLVWLQEDVRQGQRIARFSVEALQDGRWVEVAAGTTIGYRRLVRLPSAVAPSVRVRVWSSKDVPMLSEIKIYQLSNGTN